MIGKWFEILPFEVVDVWKDGFNFSTGWGQHLPEGVGLPIYLRQKTAVAVALQDRMQLKLKFRNREGEAVHYPSSVLKHKDGM